MNPQEQPPIAPNLPPQPQPIQGPMTAPQAIGEDPGKTLAIIGLVVTLMVPLAGLIGIILSAVARRKSRKAGHKNTLALAGIIIGIIVTLCEILVTALIVMTFAHLITTCAELGPGVYKQGATTITCGNTEDS